MDTLLTLMMKKQKLYVMVKGYVTWQLHLFSNVIINYKSEFCIFDFQAAEGLLDDDLTSKAKQSRSEKKARKAMAKLGE